jgi:hypothetical protein
VRFTALEELGGEAAARAHPLPRARDGSRAADHHQVIARIGHRVTSEGAPRRWITAQLICRLGCSGEGGR